MPDSAIRMVAHWNKRNGLLLVARLILGSAFVYLGGIKASDPVGFLKLLRQFELTQSPLLLNSIAALLPWFEVFCGGMLLAGAKLRGTALLVLGMLVGFTTLVFFRALEIYGAGKIAFCAIRFNCGCGAGDVLICQKLLENSALCLLAFALLASRPMPNGDPKTQL